MARLIRVIIGGSKLPSEADRRATMANMSYCRFSNTLADLRDCWSYMDDAESLPERKAKIKLIELCQKIAGSYDADDIADMKTEIKEEQERLDAHDTH